MAKNKKYSKEISCKQCYKTFVVSRDGGSSFCSKECYLISYSVPTEIVDSFVFDYVQKEMSMRAIGKKYGFSDVVVKKYLTQRKISLRSRQMTTLKAKGNLPAIQVVEDPSDLLLDYEKGMTANSLLEKYSISKELLASVTSKSPKSKEIRQENSLQNRSLAYNINVFNQKSFSAEDAYWIGFLLTDGYINAKKGVVSIELGMKDVDHLEKFAVFLGLLPDQGIYHIDYKNTVRFMITSRALVDKLAYYNIIPRKSFTAEAPTFLENDSNFWRGVVDGDGSVVSRKSRHIALYSASETLIKQFINWARNFVDESSICLYTDQRKENPVYSVVIRGGAAQILSKILYADSKEIVALNRKYFSAIDIVENYEIRGSRLFKKKVFK